MTDEKTSLTKTIDLAFAKFARSAVMHMTDENESSYFASFGFQPGGVRYRVKLTIERDDDRKI